MNRMSRWQSKHAKLFCGCGVVMAIACITNDPRDDGHANSFHFALRPAFAAERASVVVASLSTATHGRQPSAATSFDAQPSSSAKVAQSAPAPPSGWEMPQVAPKKKGANNPEDAPACCGFDKLCCARQSDIDRGIRVPARQNFSVPFAKIPEPTIKERAKDGPPIEGFTGIRVVDGAGTPFPWVDGPQQFEVRLIPEGKVGFIRFGEDHSAGHYGDPKYRSLGYGLTLPINPTPDKGRSLLKGPIEYWTFNAGEGDQIIHDHIKGQLDASPNIIGERWERAIAINAAEGVVHTYRAQYDGQPHVFFLLPEVVVGFESPKAKSFGGTGNDRFASDFPYTLYRFPLGPGHSDTINCILRDYEVRRWFPRAKDGAKLPDELPIIISMSQTSAENEPRIRVMFL